MQNDPLETIIAWLAVDLTAAQGRVAGEHRYGVEPHDEGWAIDQLGVVVSLDDGLGTLYGQAVRGRMEVNIYGPARSAIIDAWRELEALATNKKRFLVQTTLGNVLVHYFNQQTGFSLTYDEDVKLDVGVVFYEALVAKEVVS